MIEEYDGGEARVSNYVTEQEASTVLGRVVTEVNDKLKFCYTRGTDNG